MLKVENLSKHYENDNGNNVVILNNITINFPNSGIVFVLGKSGSGKTALLYCIALMDNKSSYKYFYDGPHFRLLPLPDENEEKLNNLTEDEDY